MTIQEFFQIYPQAGIACSGGVDSIFLLYLATKYAKKVKAYFVKSPFQPQFELEDAKKMCAELGADLEILPIDVLACEKVAQNEASRCYFCKYEIFTNIKMAALEDGFDVLLDGTNASDDFGDRPGMKALQELEVLSPLRICGYTKSEIRSQAKEAGLFVHNKPSYACLATRIPTGTKITKDRLEKVEEAENILFSMGFSDFRVRIFHDAARIQIPEIQLPKFMEERGKIEEQLTNIFDVVMLDLQTR